jgi:hypothetical protein
VQGTVLCLLLGWESYLAFFDLCKTSFHMVTVLSGMRGKIDSPPKDSLKLLSSSSG